MPVSDKAATLPGIHNENDFYSAHYLSEVFSRDINQVIKTWEKQEESDPQYQAPHNRLKSMAKDYFAMQGCLKNERGHQAAMDMQRKFFREFCAALDIPWNPQNIQVQAAELPAEPEPCIQLISVLARAED